MKMCGGALAATGVEDVKDRTRTGAAARWLLYPANFKGRTTLKGVRVKVHMCPASALEQNSQTSDNVILVQNNWQDKPCVHMMNMINDARDGDHFVILTKTISKQQFLDLKKEQDTDQQRAAGNVDRCWSFCCLISSVFSMRCMLPLLTGVMQAMCTNMSRIEISEDGDDKGAPATVTVLRRHKRVKADGAGGAPAIQERAAAKVDRCFSLSCLCSSVFTMRCV